MDVDKAGGGERPPTEKELFCRAESGDAAAFASLAPADLSQRNESGRSLLHVAAAAGHPQVVLAVLQCGADAAESVLNAQDEEGWAPVHSAASSGNSHIMNILLERGADVDLVTHGGKTALHYAVNKGKLDIAEKLIAYGANVNMKDKLGCTPLHAAAGTGHVELCELLAKEGAEVDAIDKTRQTPLKIAVGCENMQVVLVLVRHNNYVEEISFKSDYYIKLLHSRFQRFHEAPLHCCDDSPPLILQLTFHSDFDCNNEFCHDPLSYFRVNRAIKFMPGHILVEKSDGAKCTLSKAGQRFVSSLNRIIEENNSSGYCIAPAIHQGNVAVSSTTGESMLLIPKCYRLGEEVDSEVMTIDVSYTAAADYFEWLLKKIEGDDILERLCDSVKDLLSKMRWHGFTQDLSHWFERLIQNHPSLMGIEGVIYFIREADMVLNREFRYTGTEQQKNVAKTILRNLPYLPYGSHEPWTEIAKRHSMLNYWYRFRQDSAGKSKAPLFRIGHEAMLLKQGQVDSTIMSYSDKSTLREQHKAMLVKQGKIDSTTKSCSEKLFEKLKSGSGLVSLHRDAVAHPYEKALEEIEMVSKIWPYDLSYVVSVLTVNYPAYLPNMAENIATCGA